MKKGQVGGYVTVVVGLIIAIALFVNLAFPQIRTMTTAQESVESVAHTTSLESNTTTTLDNTDMVNSGLSIAGLTVNLNYTIDYDTAKLRINDTTNNGTYSVVYDYYAPGYIATTGTRAMAGVMVLVLIIGLAMMGFRMFGVL